jgi:hypothetical protein
MHRIAPFLTLALVFSLPTPARSQDALTPDRIDQSVGELLNAFVTADQDEIATIRTRIRSLYNVARGEDLKFQFGKAVSSHIPGVLEKLKANDQQGLNRLRRVNLGIVVRLADTPSIQPALEALLEQKCPASRYSAWKRYSTLWPAVLSQSLRDTETLVSSMGQALETETNPIILDLVVDIASFSAPAEFNVPARPQAQARRAMIEAISANLTRFRKAIDQGDTSMALLSWKIVRAWRDLYDQAQRDPGLKKKWLQVLADLMWSSANAYQQTDATGDERARQIHERILIGAEDVLISRIGEQVGSADQGLNKVFRALEDPNATGTSVKLAVLEWVKLLKPLGVKAP